jgi:hypothetical protein
LFNRLLALNSKRNAFLPSREVLTPLSNLKIELERASEVNPGGEIYAEVIGTVEALWRGWHRLTPGS